MACRHVIGPHNWRTLLCPNPVIPTHVKCYLARLRPPKKVAFFRFFSGLEGNMAGKPERRLRKWVDPKISGPQET